MKLIVDLDDTLVNTTTLNNDAYNFSLEKHGYPRIKTKDRLTRDSLSFVNSNDLSKIIKTKQEYFTNKWLPYRTILNKVLIDKIKQNGVNDCVIWTKASESRVSAILECCNLKRYFSSVIFDDKSDFKLSMAKISDKIKTNTFIVYENNFTFFENQQLQIIDNINNNFFNVKGFLISI